MTPFTIYMIAFAAIRLLAIVAIALGGIALSAKEASAFSSSVKLACASDYLSHCSKYSLSSPEVRQCMSAVGPNLSKGCIEALVSAGEVSRSEVDRRLASAR